MLLVPTPPSSPNPPSAVYFEDCTASSEIAIINSGHGLCIFSHSNSVWNQTVITELVACCAPFLMLPQLSKWAQCNTEGIMHFLCVCLHLSACLFVFFHALVCCWWQELLHRTSLETQKLSLMGEVSYLKLKLADMEGRQTHGAEKQHNAEVGKAKHAMSLWLESFLQYVDMIVLCPRTYLLLFTCWVKSVGPKFELTINLKSNCIFLFSKCASLRTVCMEESVQLKSSGTFRLLQSLEIFT